MNQRSTDGRAIGARPETRNHRSLSVASHLLEGRRVVGGGGQQHGAANKCDRASARVCVFVRGCLFIKWTIGMTTGQETGKKFKVEWFEKLD